MPDALWEQIEPLLSPGKPHPLGCHRPRVDHRKAMDALFFVLRTGIPWNALKETGICSRSRAHRRFQEWTQAGVFAALWKQGLETYDALIGLDWAWQAMDGAMPQAPLGGKKTGKNPTDRGKKGTKRSLHTEGAGVPVGLAVEGSHRNDFKRVRETLESIPVERPAPSEADPQGMSMDKGYDYNEGRDLVREFGYTAHIRARGEEAQAITQEAGYKARRWVVERTHSWMNRFRRILIRWEKKAENYLALLHLACAYITYRKAGLLG
ncbi:MAG: IS5 family transposase [Armatimonadetes bacterium]|nr:IS5 family transposase [Armatimonadota bacterium]